MPADLRPVRRTIVGSAPGIAAALDTAVRQRRLVSVSPPRLDSVGRYVVTAILLEPAQRLAERPARRTPTRVPRRLLWGVLGVLGLSIVGAVVAVLAVAVQWAHAHWPALAAVTLSALVTAGFLALRRGRCAGLHCGGCR